MEMPQYKDIESRGSKEHQNFYCFIYEGSTRYCCYLKWLKLESGGYAVYQDCYVEHDYEGRSGLDAEDNLFTMTRKPKNEDCKQALMSWLNTTCAWRWKG